MSAHLLENKVMLGSTSLLITVVSANLKPFSPSRSLLFSLLWPNCSYSIVVESSEFTSRAHLDLHDKLFCTG